MLVTPLLIRYRTEYVPLVRPDTVLSVRPAVDLVRTLMFDVVVL